LSVYRTGVALSLTGAVVATVLMTMGAAVASALTTMCATDWVVGCGVWCVGCGV